METDRICMESDSDNTFYHIFTQIRMRISRIRIQNECLEFGNPFKYLIDLEDNIYQFFIDNLQLQNHVKSKYIST
jgi:hypothetical protein